MKRHLYIVQPEPESVRPSINRAYTFSYHGPGTRCPGCGGQAFWIGRVVAECAFEKCGAALWRTGR